MTESNAVAPHPTRQLLILAVPAYVIGVASSLILLGLSEIADWVEDLLWDTIPDAVGVSGDSRWWIVLMLTLTGVAVGLVVWRVPGHAGPDPATQELVDAPMPVTVLPGLVLTLILMLAGGVSLGPENPITATNIALAYFLGKRFMPGAPAETWVGLAAAGTIGALFGTPVAAALILSEAATGDPRVPLWDRLFAPLVAAGAGALTTVLIADDFSLAVAAEPYRGFEVIDAFTGSAIAAIAALIGLAAVYAYPLTHRYFYRIPNPVLMLAAGGLVLGILGAVGGPITLFKGLEQMKELTSDVADYSAGELVLIVVVKLVALVIAATSGFRGGRIFPAVFIGTAIGLLANTLVSEIPQALAITCGVLGMLLAVTRGGWLSLFTAAIIVPQLNLLPVLCVVSLPAWLLVRGAPPMLIPKETVPAPKPVPAA